MGSWYLHITHIGNRCSDFHSWQTFDLRILLHTNSAVVALKQISRYSVLRKDLCLWGKHHQVVARTPALADYLITYSHGCLRRCAQENKCAGSQEKATARKRTFARLPPEK